MPLIIDGHLDLAWNALSYDRDLTRSIHEVRQREQAIVQPAPGQDQGPPIQDQATVTLHEMRVAGVAVCFASLLARARPEVLSRQRPSRTEIDYINQEAAYAIAQGQLAYYRLLEQQGHLQIIHDVQALDGLWAQWVSSDPQARPPLGVILSMEGADPIVTPDQATHWFDQGLRAVSLAHYGPSAYAYGTPGNPDTPDAAQAGVTPSGRLLLQQLGAAGVMLDLTHASDASFFEAADQYPGPVFASHSNCRALVPGPRQLRDDQIRLIADRGGVIGCVMEGSMLQAGWQPSESAAHRVPLSAATDHIDHICQLTGCVDHVGIGSDLDGGFGTRRCPRELDTIAHLAKLGPLLAARGYSDTQINAVFHGNWRRFLRAALPTGGGRDGGMG